MNEIPAEIRRLVDNPIRFARGRTGATYHATSIGSGRRGLLKILDPRVVGDEAKREQVKGELERQSRLRHPSLVVPWAVGETEGWMWSFRDHVPSRTLARRLEEDGPLDESAAVVMLARLAEALDVLHGDGLLFRDLQPSHLAVGDDGTVQAFGAGVAPLFTHDGRELSGSPEYLSPEQVEGGLASFRSDLYALGCVFYAALTGRPPFVGEAADVLQAHRMAEPSLPEEITPKAREVLAALLEKDPKRRPFSAREVRRALEPLLPDSYLSVGAARASSAGSLPPEAAVAPSAGDDVRRERPSRATVGGRTSPGRARRRSSAPPDPGSPAATASAEDDGVDLLEGVTPRRSEAPRAAKPSWVRAGGALLLVAGVLLFGYDLLSDPDAPTEAPSPADLASSSAPPPFEPPFEPSHPESAHGSEPRLGARMADSLGLDVEGALEVPSTERADDPAEPEVSSTERADDPAEPEATPSAGTAALDVGPSEAEPSSDPEERGAIPGEGGSPSAVASRAAAAATMAAPTAAAAPSTRSAPTVAARERSTRGDSERSARGDSERSTRGESTPFARERETARRAFEGGQFRLAEQAYIRASLLEPRHAGVWAGLGSTRVQLRDFEGAAQAFERAVQLQPSNAGFLTSLGHAYRAAGNRSAARESYERALAINPSHPSARDALSRL